MANEVKTLTISVDGITIDKQYNVNVKRDSQGIITHLIDENGQDHFSDWNDGKYNQFYYLQPDSA